MHAVIIAQLPIRGHTLDRHEYWRRVGLAFWLLLFKVKKNNDPWYRSYDDSVIPRYIIYDDLVIAIIYDNLVIARYMTILLYCSK